MMNIFQLGLEEGLEPLMPITLLFKSSHHKGWIEVTEMEWVFPPMLKPVTEEAEDMLAPQMKKELMALMKSRMSLEEPALRVQSVKFMTTWVSILPATWSIDKQNKEAINL